jgi:hypothetical protein
LVTALSRLLTPLKLASSDGGAAARAEPVARGDAVTRGAAVEEPRGIRRAPRVGGVADADAVGAALGAAVVPTGETVPVTALADDATGAWPKAPGARTNPRDTTQASAREKRARLPTVHLLTRSSVA